MTTKALVGHWQSAAWQWQQVGPPLRPQAADVEIFTRIIHRHVEARRHGESHPLRALILGVTPEIYRLTWPRGTELKAVDHALAMIDEVWPGSREDAICAEWTALPLESESRDVVVCDGGLHLLQYPDQQSALATELSRVIAPGGLFILRLFVPPQRHSPYHGELTDHVLDQLLAGQIADLNVLKFRLWMTQHRGAAEGVAVRNIWRVVHERAADLDALALQIDWKPEHLRALQVYRDSPNRYHLVTSEEAAAVFCQGGRGFAPCELITPKYPLGDQCPILVFRRQ
jgi:SAM-dependent methyltransferase